MAAGKPQEGTVYVRLCSLLPRHASSTVRRLLVVAGLVVAGWLLGSAGQAHADTTVPPPVADVLPHTSVVDDGGDGAGKAAGNAAGLAEKASATVHVRSVRGSAKTTSPAHPRGRATAGTAHGVRQAPWPTAATLPDGGVNHLAHTLADPVLNLFGQGGMHGVVSTVSDVLAVRPLAIFERLPVKIKRAVVGFVSAGSAANTPAPGVFWIQRHRGCGAAGSGDQKANGTAARGHQNTGTGAGASFSHLAPRPMSPPMSPQPGGVSVLSGSAHTGGELGHVIRLGADARSALVLPQVLGAVPPAVHAATDEPSLSPD